MRYRVRDADGATTEDRISSATALILAAGTFGSCDSVFGLSLVGLSVSVCFVSSLTPVTVRREDGRPPVGK